MPPLGDVTPAAYQFAVRALEGMHIRAGRVLGWISLWTMNERWRRREGEASGVCGQHCQTPDAMYFTS